MSVVERFFERLVERPSARLFGTRVQPIQLQRRIERAMEHGRSVEPGGPRVPDRFTIRLSRRDLDRLGSVEALPVELASAALEWARRHGYAVAARPRVAITADDRLRGGDIEVEARFSETGSGPDLNAPPDLGQTRIFAAPAPSGPRATLALTEPDGRRWTVVADGTPLTIGRSSGNAIVLADERVSRQHARLHARGGVLVLTDLEARNGTFVNGARITEIVIGAGDVIEIGSTIIDVVAIDDGIPAHGGAALGDDDGGPS